MTGLGALRVRRGEVVESEALPRFNLLSLAAA